MDGKVILDAKAGCEHTVLLTANHEVWTFGHGDSGRLGHGDNQTRKTPARIEQLSQGKMKPVAIAAGDKYNILLVGECDTEEHSSHESNERRMGNRRKRNAGREHNVELMLSKRQESASAGSHILVDDSNPPALHSRHFQVDWVLGLVESSSSIESSGSPRYQARALPTTVRSTLLFVLGHIDRVAAEYRHADCGEERDDSQCIQATEAIMPFAIEASTAALRAIAELLTSPVSALHELVSTQDVITTSSKGLTLFCYMLAQDRVAVALSLLRVLQLNISRVAALRSQATVDGVLCPSSNDDQLIKGTFDLVSGITKLDDDKLARMLRADDDNQVNGCSRCSLAIRHEAAMVLKVR